MLPWIAQEFLTCANDGPLVLEPELLSDSAGSCASGKLEGDCLLFIHQTTTSMMHRSEHVETTAATSTTTP